MRVFARQAPHDRVLRQQRLHGGDYNSALHAVLAGGATEEAFTSVADEALESAESAEVRVDPDRAELHEKAVALMGRDRELDYQAALDLALSHPDETAYEISTGGKSTLAEDAAVEAARYSAAERAAERELFAQDFWEEIEAALRDFPDLPDDDWRRDRRELDRKAKVLAYDFGIPYVEALRPILRDAGDAE